MKLWGGRFEKGTDELVNDFNSSIRFDKRMYKQDIAGSIAHAKMLGKCGVISADESKLITDTLKEILGEIEEGKACFMIDAEDIHMNIETMLIEKIGDTGKKLHTGRSRNDQVALDIRMYLRDETDEIVKMLKNLLSVLIKIAKDNLETIMPGYTHLQKAQPITLAHHMCAYTQMFERDIMRLCDLRKRINIMPLGSGALAATTYPFDREFVAKELSFDDITYNSLDGVSDRDFVIEMSSALSIIMMHLSRFCEELILWNSNEFSFVEMDDSCSTGSSIMPQKKNPDVAELIRGKTGRVYGSLITILTVMKGIPLAYNKDMQEDKECVFDAIDTVKLCIPVFAKMLDTLKFNKEAMYKGAGGGFTNATDVADYLVRKNIPFRKAHEIVGKTVLYATKKGKSLSELTIDEYKEICPEIDEDIYDAIDLKTCVEGRKITGGPAKEAVLKTIEKDLEFLEKDF